MEDEWIEDLCKKANGELKKFHPLYTICLLEDGYIKFDRNNTLSVVVTGEIESKLTGPPVIRPMYVDIEDVQDINFETVGNEIKIEVKSRGTTALIELEKNVVGKPEIKTIDIQTTKIDLRANVTKLKHMESRYKKIGF